MLITEQEAITRIERLQQEIDEALSFDLPVQHIQHEIDAISKKLEKFSKKPQRKK